MARPVIVRTTYDKEVRTLLRIASAVQADPQGSSLWHCSVEERLTELVGLMLAENARRRREKEE